MAKKKLSEQEDYTEGFSPSKGSVGDTIEEQTELLGTVSNSIISNSPIRHEIKNDIIKENIIVEEEKIKNENFSLKNSILKNQNYVYKIHDYHEKNFFKEPIYLNSYQTLRLGESGACKEQLYCIIIDYLETKPNISWEEQLQLNLMRDIIKSAQRDFIVN